jgi:hypothetical protein
MCAGGREGLCCSRLGSEVREDTVGRRGPLLGCEFKAMELQGLSSVDPSCAATQEKRLRSRIPGSTRDRPGQPPGTAQGSQQGRAPPLLWEAKGRGELLGRAAPCTPREPRTGGARLTQEVVDAQVAQRLGHVADGGTEVPQGQRLLRLLPGARQLALVLHTVE